MESPMKPARPEPTDDIDWDEWDRTIDTFGFVIERPAGSAHPRFNEWIYPVDYGHVPNTVGADGAEVDIFAGSSACGLVGAIFTIDRLKRDRELKLLLNVSDAEIESILTFLRAGELEPRLVRRS
jgi:inorganic pyrophosphatase